MVLISTTLWWLTQCLIPQSGKTWHFPSPKDQLCSRRSVAVVVWLWDPLLLHQPCQPEDADLRRQWNGAPKRYITSMTEKTGVLTAPRSQAFCSNQNRKKAKAFWETHYSCYFPELAIYLHSKWCWEGKKIGQLRISLPFSPSLPIRKLKVESIGRTCNKMWQKKKQLS